MAAIVTWLGVHVSITWVYVAIAVMQVGIAVMQVLNARQARRNRDLQLELLDNDQQINAQLGRLAAQLMASRLLYRNANLQHSLSFGFLPEHETTADPSMWADENRRAAGVDVGPPESILGLVEEEGARQQDD